jgi:uncharacterized integral membrane protein
MKTKTVVILVLVALVAILLLQNSGLTPLRLFFWNIYAPLFILVLVIFLLGALVGHLTAHRDRKKETKTGEEKPPHPAAPEAPPAKPHP